MSFRGIVKATTPHAVKACHELILWLIPQLDKFPRVRRFTLGERLEAMLLEVLERLVEEEWFFYCPVGDIGFDARSQGEFTNEFMRMIESTPCVSCPR